MDGVHLGQEDMDIKNARKIIGKKIIGVSTHNIEEAVKAEKLGADYIGVGAVFSTESKSNTIPIPIEKLSDITSTVSIPVIAIGGINDKNIYKLKNTGISGVAVISSIFSSDNVFNSTKKIKSIIMEYEF